MFKESEISKERLSIDVSIIINVHNQPLSLKLALRSLLAQDFTGFQEVIVADDGSDSDTFSGFYQDFDRAGIPLKYVWQQDRGMRENASFNNGIRLARGGVVEVSLWRTNVSVTSSYRGNIAMVTGTV